MEAEGYFWNLTYIYFNIPLCLLKHIDVSSRNNENGLYCFLRGGVGDSRGDTKGKP